MKNKTQILKKMLKLRDSIKQDIWWEPTVGSSSIWFDNWTRLGELYYVVEYDFEIKEENRDIESFITKDSCDIQKLEGLLPEDIVEYIVNNITISNEESP